MSQDQKPLCAAFVSRLGGGAEPIDRAGQAGIEQLLQTALAEAREAWPDIDLEATVFAAELGGCAVGSKLSIAARLEKLHTSDLFIAKAVVHGVVGAIAAFEARFFPEVARAVATLDRSSAFADEVRQVLRERFFLQPSQTTGLGQYSGKGPLTKWLRISALRVATRLREGQERETDIERLDKIADRALQTQQSDPEVEYLKATYRREFRQAFHDALAVLSPRARNVLRLQTLDGLNGEQIAAFYNVSRASSSRWLADARQTLHSRTRELLAERLGLGTQQLESLAGLILSQLDLSLGRVLQE